MSLTKRARIAAGLAATTATFGLSFASAPPASADVCAKAGATTDGSTPQQQGTCVVLFPEWTVCSYADTRVDFVRFARTVCVIVPGT